MTTRFDVPAGEFGVVRLFEVALDDPAAQRRFLDDPTAQARALGLAEGGGALDRAHVDVIRPGALDGVGLARFLVDGIGVPEAALAPDRARLDALERPVLVVLSKALGGAATRLELHPPLRWAGTYEQERAAPVHQQSHRVEGRMPAARAPAEAPRMRGLWVFVALAGLGLLAVILLLVAGRT